MKMQISLGSKIITSCLILGSLLAGPALAQSTCGEDRHISNNIQLGRDSFNDGTVYVSVHPMKVSDMIYRDYLFTAEGLLMVFNSYGWGDNSESTAARDFYFFPRKNSCIDYTWNAEGDLLLTMANGKVVQVSQSSAQISAIEGGSVTVADDVLPNNQGGLEFPTYNGLMLDAGFKKGSSPTDDPSATSTFRDENGQTCSVVNKSIFDYSNDDSRLKFDDVELKKFLNKKCPKLVVNF